MYWFGGGILGPGIVYWNMMTDHINYGLLGDGLQVDDNTSFETSEKFEALDVGDKVTRPCFGAPSQVAKKRVQNKTQDVQYLLSVGFRTGTGKPMVLLKQVRF